MCIIVYIERSVYLCWMTMTTSAERKFINLRKRLDQLGYRQPLAIESLPLVEKLFRWICSFIIHAELYTNTNFGIWFSSLDTLALLLFSLALAQEMITFLSVCKK